MTAVLKYYWPAVLWAIFIFTMHQTTARYLEGAVHHNPPFSPRGLSERIFSFWFNSFVYNQIWEDPRVDLKALALTPESRRLSLAAAG